MTIDRSLATLVRRTIASPSATGTPATSVARVAVRRKYATAMDGTSDTRRCHDHRVRGKPNRPRITCDDEED
jgi:hypothetical protein